MPPSRRHLFIFFSALAASSLMIMICSVKTGHTEESACGSMTAAEEQVVQLQQDKQILNLRIKQIEAKTLSLDRLSQKKAQRLKEIAADVKVQREATADFEGFVKWMCANLTRLQSLHPGWLSCCGPCPFPAYTLRRPGLRVHQIRLCNSPWHSMQPQSLSNAYLSSSQNFIAMTD